AGAIEMLAKNGLNLDQIMQGAARSTVLLANSTGADFATAADIATDVMAQFGYGAEQMSAVVDGITGVTQASKFSIDDYRLALAQAGGVASSVGVDFDDFNATIAAISPLFAGGSDAGTSFKVFLQRLVPQSDKAKDTMAELGLIINDWGAMAKYLSEVLGRDVEPSLKGVFQAFQETKVGAEAAAKGEKALGDAFNLLRVQFERNQFFDDQTGQMKSMAEIAGILETAFADLSEEQIGRAHV